MRDRGHILDKINLEAKSLKSSNCGLSSGSRTFYVNITRFHSGVYRFLGSHFSCLLSGKGSALPRSLEALSSRTRPRNNVTVRVRKGNDCVVERSVNMNDPNRNVLFFFFLCNLLCPHRTPKLQQNLNKTNCPVSRFFSFRQYLFSDLFVSLRWFLFVVRGREGLSCALNQHSNLYPSSA